MVGGKSRGIYILVRPNQGHLGKFSNYRPSGRNRAYVLCVACAMLWTQNYKAPSFTALLKSLSPIDVVFNLL